MKFVASARQVSEAMALHGAVWMGQPHGGTSVKHEAGVGEEQRQFLQQTRTLARINNSTSPQRNRKSQPIDTLVVQGKTFGTHNFPETYH
jgi:hypothetical protein